MFWTLIPRDQGLWFTDSDKTKILIFGNSHGKDLYNAFVQNLNLFERYEFQYFQSSLKKLAENTEELTKSPGFIQASVILISTRYYVDASVGANDLFYLDKALEKLNLFSDKN